MPIFVPDPTEHFIKVQDVIDILVEEAKLRVESHGPIIRIANRLGIGEENIPIELDGRPIELVGHCGQPGDWPEDVTWYTVNLVGYHQANKSKLLHILRRPFEIPGFCRQYYFVDSPKTKAGTPGGVEHRLCTESLSYTFNIIKTCSTSEPFLLFCTSIISEAQFVKDQIQNAGGYVDVIESIEKSY